MAELWVKFMGSHPASIIVEDGVKLEDFIDLYIRKEQLYPLTTRMVTAKHNGEELTVRDLDVSMLVTTYDNPILLEDRTVTKTKDFQRYIQYGVYHIWSTFHPAIRCDKQ